MSAMHEDEINESPRRKGTLTDGSDKDPSNNGSLFVNDLGHQ